MSNRKLSPLEIELLLVCIEGVKATSYVDPNDPGTKLVLEAEKCLQNLKVKFDPAVSNRLWNISNDSTLTSNAEYRQNGGGDCVITYFFDLMVKKVRESIMPPPPAVVAAIQTLPTSEFMPLTSEQEKIALELIGTVQIPNERKRRFG